MVLLVRAILPGRAASSCLASATALAVGESLASCPQLSPHCGNELLEAILKKGQSEGKVSNGHREYHSKYELIRVNGQLKDAESSETSPSTKC